MKTETDFSGEISGSQPGIVATGKIQDLLNSE